MFSRLIPRETGFFDFFDKHAALVVKASREFLEIVSAETLDLTNKPNYIRALEHEADEIVHDCLQALHKTFITPINRDDIYRLVSKMDDIIDALNVAYRCLIVYKVSSTTPELKKLAHIVSLCADKVQTVVKELRHVKNVEMISAVCIEIHQLENEADDLLYSTVGRLFDEQTDARQIIKWKEIYEILEGATDRCEDVADVVQGIILESL